MPMKGLSIRKQFALLTLVFSAPLVLAEPELVGFGMPDAHYWAERPGTEQVRPQATVEELYGLPATDIPLEVLQQPESDPGIRQANHDYQNAQLYRPGNSTEEPVNGRFAATQWQYGWGVGLEEVKLRISYDF